MADEKPIVGRTKHGELTLDQIAELQPGLGTLMREVSDLTSGMELMGN